MKGGKENPGRTSMGKEDAAYPVVASSVMQEKTSSSKRPGKNYHYWYSGGWTS
jgi:hypothetical protein